MDFTERFFRGEVLHREQRLLSAELYNRARLLLNRCGATHLFVPIRSMQYQAVLDTDEFIFVDGLGDRHVELAWRSFRPQERSGLNDPVRYECVFYDPSAAVTLRRLQTEFAQALLEYEQRSKVEGGVIVPLR
jgi:hypothetical protein